MLFSLFVLVTGSGCSVGYRNGLVVAEEMRAPLSASIAAAGILDRRGGQSEGVRALHSGGRWIASTLGIPDVSAEIATQELELLETPPAELVLHADQLAALSDRIGTQFLVSGTAGVELVDLEKRWVILIVIPLLTTVITIPIPVTYGEEPGLSRAALTTRVVDLRRAEVVGTSIEVQVREAGKGEFNKSHVAASLKSLDLTKKHLRKEKGRR